MSKVLIIEDDPYVRRFYERLFKSQAYTVDIASGGEEGITLAKSQHPQLILLDILMPNLNGIDVLKTLKADQSTHDISVIMLTNLDDTKTIREAMALGAGGFIIKSNASGDSLLALVEQYLEESSTEH